jgi:hypothetical protein
MEAKMESRTEIVPVQLADGTTVKIKASVLGGYEDVGAFDKLLPFEDVTNTIESVAGAMVKTLEKVKPDKASVEFGVEVGVESGALTTFLVQGTGTGNIKVTLEWEREKDEK